MTLEKKLSALEISSVPVIHKCERNWRWTQPRFTDHDFWFVLGGKGFLEHNGTKVAASRGLAVIFHPGDSVRAWHDEEKPLRVFAVHFRIFLTRKHSTAIVPPRVLIHDPSLMESQALSMIRAYKERSDDGLLLARLLLAGLLVQCSMDNRSECPNAQDLRLKEICQRVAEEPGRSWQVAEMAGLASLSVSQFNRRFRQLTGTSPARYLIERRMDRARRLLLESGMNLKEIAAALNYGDIYYFHRQFRQEVGCTPTDFRTARKPIFSKKGFRTGRKGSGPL